MVGTRVGEKDRSEELENVGWKQWWQESGLRDKVHNSREVEGRYWVVRNE